MFLKSFSIFHVFFQQKRMFSHNHAENMKNYHIFTYCQCVAICFTFDIENWFCAFTQFVFPISDESPCLLTMRLSVPIVYHKLLFLVSPPTVVIIMQHTHDLCMNTSCLHVFTTDTLKQNNRWINLFVFGLSQLSQ